MGLYNQAKDTEYNPAKSREQLKALGLENLNAETAGAQTSQRGTPVH
ncbi:hypothetical protein ACLK18_07385 [Escherichia coli]